MKLTDKTSNMMLFGALMLTRRGKHSLPEALACVPLSGGTRRLADLLAEFRPVAPEAGPESPPANIPEGEDAAREGREACDPQLGNVHPIYGSQHVANSGTAGEITTSETRLRCPVCWNETTVALDTWQRDHLHIRGHLERYCEYCGTESLWELASAAKQHPSALVSLGL